MSGRSPQFQSPSPSFTPADLNQPALLTRLLRPTHRYAERFATSSPTSPRVSFAFPPCGLPAALAQPFGISPRFLPAPFYVRWSSAGSSRFLPIGRPAASNRPFGTHCLRRELLPAFGISRNPGKVLISLSHRVNTFLLRVFSNFRLSCPMTQQRLGGAFQKSAQACGRALRTARQPALNREETCLHQRGAIGVTT